MTDIRLLPPGEIETRAVLKKAAEAHRYLAELKGVAAAIPNQEILIDTLSLQEARESSAIENIISTLSDVYQSRSGGDTYKTPASKEVHTYARALQRGFELIGRHRLITLGHIQEIQAIIESNSAGFRRLPGTVLKNELTGEVIYTPPQEYDTIMTLMANLQDYINDPAMSDADPLVKMAVIHHRFESIHPFYDGNGRTGRILCILYLIQQGLLDLPVLYLSRYIIGHKAEYYRLLQAVRDTDDWEPWLLYMLEAVKETSRDTLRVIMAMRGAMERYQEVLQQQAPKLYSQELLHTLFRHPYTKIEYLMRDLRLSRSTVVRYLETLQSLDLVNKIKSGRDNYYLNTSLLKLLIEPEFGG